MVKGVGIGLMSVHTISSLRNRLCLRARFFAPLKNDSARCSSQRHRKFVM
ncbi:MAG: hypothetical protein IJX06_02435 [Clostridia bacterium]|nr:hypothetical protein [Clostridia bacterium]